MKRVATSVVLTFVLAAGLSAQKPTGTAGAKEPRSAGKAAHVMFLPSEAKWSPGPNFLPGGSEVTVIEGDPGKPGPFTLQLKMPSGYRVAPHWHPTDERQTIVKGTLLMGMGDTWKDGEMKEMTPGAFVMLPKKNSHYVVARNEVIMQIEATGPFDLTYIDPKDDPRKKQQ